MCQSIQILLQCYCIAIITDTIIFDKACTCPTELIDAYPHRIWAKMPLSIDIVGCELTRKCILHFVLHCSHNWWNCHMAVSYHRPQFHRWSSSMKSYLHWLTMSKRVMDDWLKFCSTVRFIVTVTQDCSCDSDTLIHATLQEKMYHHCH